ncbi:GNAT family N-acetyltransferase [Fulvivirga sedimenti]|uniref:GNAT family N-acetyltransferase n=1 Tax=Fulvivirga sedimenti TaxID=2879465 RepID=A0A9X1KZE8_9BACT|nr:GNAT family N-acetyltransferase [Fulvivirga sedimenti]MCA6078828.1 GNAT family N-acetyltransferase [Fulvivirga sedimenti]
MKITESSRLLIEHATLADAEFFHRLMNSPNWIEFIGDRGIHSEKEAKEYIQNRLIASYEGNGYGLFKVSLKDTLEAIGVCGFVKRDFLDSPDIGYAILPEYENQGYISEANQVMIKYGWESLGLKIIYAITSEKNARSQHLLLKLGLHRVGNIQPEGFDPDTILYEIERRE